MGNDGGSIPTRRELVKKAAPDLTTTQVKETQQEQQEYHWTTCPLSHRLLHRPVVSDSSGRLYNKDAILEFLLPAGDGTPGTSKSDNEQVLEGRVRSLKDVVEVNFEIEKEIDSEQNGGRIPKGEKWICPITNKALGPGVKAVYLVPCGHAFSEGAIKEISGQNCLQCNEPYATENIIPILPTGSVDIHRLSSRAQSLREQDLTHSLKKASGSGKKRKKKAETGSAETSIPSTQIPRPQGTTPAPSGGIKNAATASLTAKVLEEEKEKHKRRKLGANDNLKSLFSSDNGVPKKNGDFMNRGYSIPAGAKR